MSFSGDYVKKRKRTKNYHYEKNPNFGPTDKNKWIQFPMYLQALVSEERNKCANNHVINVDANTKFPFTYKTQDASYGFWSRTKGVTIVALKRVDEIGRVLIVSERCTKVNKKIWYRGLTKLGFFIYGGNITGKNSPVMKANTQGLNTDGELMPANCKLQSMSSDVLKDRYDFHGLKKGMYVVLVNISPIDYLDPLLVPNYGRTSKMVYGKPDFIEDERKCFKAYTEALALKPVNRKLCTICFQLYPVYKKNHKLHNLNCTPYIWNFRPPNVEKLYEVVDSSDEDVEEDDEEDDTEE